MSIRIPAIEARLGQSLQDVDAQGVRRLLGQGESEDLDFKGKLYDNGQKGQNDLSVDVAALANLRGGVIMLGLDEQKSGTAKVATPVPLSDQEELRMRQIVASNVVPLPRWEIRAVPDPSSSGGHGFYLLIVAPSDQTPHAVKQNNGLKYPVRDGTSTRYLTEHEVADAYRNRFTLARARIDRLKEVEDRVESRSQSGYVPWLKLALVPASRSSLRMSNNAVSMVGGWLSEVLERLPHGSNFEAIRCDVRTGLRCFELRNALFDEEPALGIRNPEWASAHLALDGASGVGVNLMPDVDHRETKVTQEFLYVQVFSALLISVRYATDIARASGDALLRLRLPLPPGHHARNAVDQSLVLVSPMFGTDDMRRVSGSRPLNTLTLREFVSEQTVDLDVASMSMAGLATAVVRPYTDLVNAFGLAEPSTITPDGRLKLAFWHSGYQQHIRRWAERYDVPIVS
ncbi:AlbA family DNA-binding domain-containing protein [Micromonospora sp. CB01531]|uniref:AlbA family DNA-binding domain-containing protein n=1 Tax=Micromonospora sp. CB01531 TaxID=1718947 RepID=UPI0009389420|nr:ATP-binding protein [Micromonospora sp. CB01531]